MKTAFVRWTAVGMVLSGITGCLGGNAGGSPEGDAPAQGAQNAASPGKDKGAPSRRDSQSPSKAAPAPNGDDPAKADDPAGQGAEAGKLRLIEGKGWLDSEQGFLKIAGEVKNESGQWITSVKVTIRLYDASGKEINTSSITTEVAKDLHQEPIERVYSERTFVPPGETAVFYFTRDVKSIKGTYASHKLSVSARLAEDPPTMALTGFKAEKDSDGYFRVTGKIENTGRVGCRSPRAVLGLYGADGKILGALTEGPDSMFQKVLAPGQSVDVERKSIQLNGLTIDTIKGWADCDVP